MPDTASTPAPPPRIQIEDPRPLIDGGRYAAKRSVGEPLEVSATIFCDGHDVLRAVVAYRLKGGTGTWLEAPLARTDKAKGGDTWAGEWTPDAVGVWEWTITAWSDAFASWRDELGRKVAFGETELSGELSEGVVLLRVAAARAADAGAYAEGDRSAIEAAVAHLEDPAAAPSTQFEVALDDALFAAVSHHPDRAQATTLAQPVTLDVDRVRARFGSWYELFPRSFGGFAGVEAQLPRLAELGFDVLYLPPVHPIGVKNRKGPNNTLTAGPNDPGSPWAIGDREHGGHAALHPDLGTEAEFRSMVATGAELGVEIALDFAIQCSADHPWLTEHPEWFNRRPDGSLKYAENPPKKYQDIYNVNFDCEDWRGLWDALLDVALHWVESGVKVFRVDNPHTKPLAFWEWLLKEIRRTDPDVLFLSEAFTRPAMMHGLGSVGFHQSYTYFTWRTAKWEIESYLREVSTESDHLMRPNFFVNTPDILHSYLQYGGPPAFKIRAVIAALGSPSWGVYAGYELYEHVAVRPGSEEYLDTEKFQVRVRDWDGAATEGRTLAPYLTRLNQVRREHPALQQLRNVVIHSSDDEQVLVFSKQARRDDGSTDTVLAVVNLDPHATRETTVHLDLPALGLGWHDDLTVRDEITGEEYHWGRHNYVRLDPHHEPAHVLTLRSNP